MKNKALRSILVLLALMPIFLMVLIPAQAVPSPSISIAPSHGVANSSTDVIIATLDRVNPSSPGYFFLNLTIPAGYNFTLPHTGKVVSYTMINTTAGSNQIVIDITSNNTITETVDVTFSSDYGATYSTSLNQPIKNMVIGASTLKLTKPTSSAPGFLNISLGGAAGPVLAQDKVKVNLARDVLKNPGTVGDYTWFLEAKNSPTGTADTASDVVHIVKTVSHSETPVNVPEFDASIPANASIQLPSGNLTVNIITADPNVNVTNFEITLQNFTGDPIPDEKKGVESLKRLMFISVDAPALRGVSFIAMIRVNYSSIIPFLTFPEANLRLYRFNDSTGTWEITAGSGVDTTNKIVFGNVTGFSILGVMGAAAAPSGRGGGGIGGEGNISHENLANIEKSESKDMNIVTSTIVYKFSTLDIIQEIGFDAMTNEGWVTARAEQLKGRPLVATSDAPGAIYKYFNILLGSSGYGESSNIGNAYVTFSVLDDWVNNNNVVSVKLMKFKDNAWIDLKTEKISANTYRAETPGFSNFAIVVSKAVEPAATPPGITPTDTGTQGVTEVPPVTAPPATLAIIIGVIILIAIGVVVFYLVKKK